MNGTTFPSPDATWNELKSFLDNFKVQGPRYLKSDMDLVSTK